MTTSSKKESLYTWIWLGFVLLLGVAMRFGFSTLGHHFDFESYRIIADDLAQGKNVYASTDRYNYGPIWFNILHLLDTLADHDPGIFRYWLISLLTAADIAIASILLVKCGPFTATLFFLNPISILITGYHNMFDNVAVLIGMIAVLLFGDDFDRPLNRRKLGGLSVLGLSLMTKHIFFVFSLWLAVKQRGRLQKCIVLLLPILIFAAGFLPYWAGSQGGIIRNVFGYSPPFDEDGSFGDMFLPYLSTYLATHTEWWIFFLAVFAFVCHKKNGFESLLLYTAVMVACSPALTDRYFVISAPFACAYPNILSLVAITFPALRCTARFFPPAWLPLHVKYDSIAIVCLFFSLIWVLWRAWILQALRHGYSEIKKQLVKSA